MEELNVQTISKNQLENTTDVVENKAENEALFLSFLQGKTDYDILENLSICDPNSIKNLLISRKFTQKLNNILTQSEALYKLIKNIDNQIIKYIFIKFLDTPKNDLIHIIKVPKLLSIPKYKIIFWELLFTYKKEDIFKIEFQKLIKNISEDHPKKKVLEVLNFGIALAEKKTYKN